MKPTLEEYWAQHSGLWVVAAKKLMTSSVVEAVCNDPLGGVDRLQSYLADSGITHFSAKEATTPHQTWPMPLLPPVRAWPAILVLAAVAERMRSAIGDRPIKMRNWWRPEDYNKVAKGAPRSDHLWACAVDLDFPDEDARRTAQKLLPSLLDSKLLSVGVGRITLHVGYAAPATLEYGPRRWKYGDLPDSETSL